MRSYSHCMLHLSHFRSELRVIDVVDEVNQREDYTSGFTSLINSVETKTKKYI